jgi:hypothetical protein
VSYEAMRRYSGQLLREHLRQDAVAFSLVFVVGTPVSCAPIFSDFLMEG